MKTKMKYLSASKNPEQDLLALAYEGQDPKRRMYHRGYEHYMNQLPVMDGEDKIPHYKSVISNMASVLSNESWVTSEMVPVKGEFIRTILALEKPKLMGEENGKPKYKEGVELVMAKWGDQYSSPVHGHSTGYLHEEILFGKIRVNTFRMISPISDIVRPLRTDIVTKGTFASLYTPHNEKNHFKRQTLIHNFTSIGYSATLHYLPEHTRDGRDNAFKVENFDDLYDLTKDDVQRINSLEGMYLQKGDVVLVRSENVPEYGDHYIIVTGHPVMKEHGLRPQDVAIHAPTNRLLNSFNVEGGLILLKLNDSANRHFLEFHNIKIDNNEVIFPQS